MLPPAFTAPIASYATPRYASFSADGHYQLLSPFSVFDARLFAAFIRRRRCAFTPIFS
jgi:hypothetical protein